MLICRFDAQNRQSVNGMPMRTDGLTLSYPFSE